MFPDSGSVAVTDGKYFWSCGHNGDLYCIYTKTHKPVLNKNIIVASQAPEAGSLFGDPTQMPGAPQMFGTKISWKF